MNYKKSLLALAITGAFATPIAVVSPHEMTEQKFFGGRGGSKKKGGRSKWPRR